MRVHRSFAFIDLSGFTALTARDGDERAVATLSVFRSAVREICSRRGVRIDKWLGDGAMLVSMGSEELLSALLEIEHVLSGPESNLAVRCGAASGDVILHEGDDYIGHAVNVAARLCDLAPAGEVYATRELAASRPAWAEVERSLGLEVKGFEEPVAVVALGLPEARPGGASCPVCGIPLRSDTAASSATDPVGAVVLFCSESCRETWDRRPEPTGEQQGSLRMPLMGA